MIVVNPEVTAIFFSLILKLTWYSKRETWTTLLEWWTKLRRLNQFKTCKVDLVEERWRNLRRGGYSSQLLMRHIWKILLIQKYFILFYFIAKGREVYDW
jgi:hypothetical protein